jgi:hypothetical protein
MCSLGVIVSAICLILVVVARRIGKVSGKEQF